VRVAEFARPATFLPPLASFFPILVEDGDAAVHVAVGHVKRAVGANRNVGRLVEMRGVPRADARLSQRKNRLTVVRELEDLLQAHVGEEHVVGAIDRNAVGHEELVGAPGVQQLSRLGIELEHGRLDQFFSCCCIEPSTGPMEYEHVTVRIDGDAGAFAELSARRQLGPVLDFLVPIRRCRM
jgi:hypothetical protein